VIPVECVWFYPLLAGVVYARGREPKSCNFDGIAVFLGAYLLYELFFYREGLLISCISPLLQRPPPEIRAGSVPLSTLRVFACLFPCRIPVTG